MLTQVQTLHNKKWILPKNYDFELCEFCEDELITSILLANGIHTIDEAKYFLKQFENKIELTSPFEILQMDIAVERVKKAIVNQEKICIYGDYDVDGTTSTAVLFLTLQHLGAEVEFYIPNRFDEGYGLNSAAILKLRSQKKISLLITCDCGITNCDEIKLAQSFGMDVIVTDHHSLPDILPPAVAILNPKMLAPNHSLYWLPGVGVAFKFAVALLEDKNNILINDLLAYVALGCIADLAPLKAENRMLVKQGLRSLIKTQRVGLKALLKECKCDFESTEEEKVGFMIAPRINAAGRLADASQAVKLFLETDEKQAQRIAADLSQQNFERQILCENILKEIIDLIEKDNLAKQYKAILLAKANWHIGILGIVASRLVEIYNLPVFLAIIDEKSNKIKGSARGIHALNLFDEMNFFASLFERFGGHKMAAGFSMTFENWEIFKCQFQEKMQTSLFEDDLQGEIKISKILDEKDLTIETVNNFMSLAPFGFSFPKPIFALNQNFTIKSFVPLGKDQKHIRLYLQGKTKIYETLMWRVSFEKLQNYIGIKKQVQCVFTLEKNIYNNLENLKLEIRDIKVAEKQFNDSIGVKNLLKMLWKYCKAKTFYEKNIFEISLEELALELNIYNHAILSEAMQILQYCEVLKFENKANNNLQIEVFLGVKPKAYQDLSKLENLLKIQK